MEEGFCPVPGLGFRLSGLWSSHPDTQASPAGLSLGGCAPWWPCGLARRKNRQPARDPRIPGGTPLSGACFIMYKIRMSRPCSLDCHKASITSGTKQASKARHTQTPPSRS